MRLLNMAGVFQSAPGEQSWYRFHNAAQEMPDATIEIELYGEIGGWGISAAEFIRELRALDDGVRPVVVSISSIGGDVFEGIAIHNALRRLGARCTARIDAVAASIASIVAVGAHRVVMPDNAMMMIHNPWCGAVGEAEDMRQVADLMDKAKDTLIACYRAKAPSLSSQELSTLMNKTTWLTAAEAKAMGLADEILNGVPIQASARLYAALGHQQGAPAALLAALKPVEPVPMAVAVPMVEPEAALAVSSEAPPVSALVVTLARLAASMCQEAGLPVVAVERVTAESGLMSEAAVQDAVGRAIEIRDLCRIAKLPDMTDTLMAAGLNVDAARERLFDRLVRDAGTELDNHFADVQEEEPKASRGPHVASVYARRRQISTHRTPFERGQ